MNIFSVTRYGRPLNTILYTWDESTRTFSTEENDLVLDFRGIHGATFKTGFSCVFTTGFNCKFNTKSHCVFSTGAYCKFTTGSHCTFTTGSHCTFTTGFKCIFKAKYLCEFTTEANCTIIRYDTLEVIKLEKNFNHIKLNGFGVLGYIKVLPEINEELNDFYLTEEDFKIKV